MKASRTNALLTVVVLAIQCAAIGWLIWRYEDIVRNGTEVRFLCQAYDPYDPLRGRYLRTTVREVCPGEGFIEDWRGRNATLYAKLEPSTNKLWRVVSVAEAPQGDGLWVKPRSVYIERAIKWSDRRKGESWDDFEKRRNASPQVTSVVLPDQLFVNERLAPVAEKVLRDATSAKGKGAVAVYRAKNGEIVITDIEIDGKSVLALARAAVPRS